MTELQATVELSMEEAEAAVREALAGQGFGVLTEIDLAATLRSKIGVERSPLKILGACSPTFANAALQIDPEAALLLPCNVVLEPGDRGGTKVSIADPRSMMPGEELAAIAEDAAARLGAVLQQLTG